MNNFHKKRCIIALISISVFGCTAESENTQASSGIAVTQAEYGGRWPLQAQEAILDCDAPDVAYVVVDDIKYALNGGALTSGLPRSDAIRKNHDDISMADFIERAMQICYSKRG